MRPMQIAAHTARRLAVNAAVFGVVICIVISFFWGVDVNLVLVLLVTGVLSGLCGAVVGLLIGLLGEEGSAAGVYRHHLSRGRYLLMIESGKEATVRWGQEVLNHYSTPSLH